MLVIPLAAVPSQNFSTVIGGQQAQINVYLLGSGAAAALYMDLASDGEPIFSARIARAYGAVPGTVAPFMLVGRHYEGFEGDLLFVDTQAGPTQPAQDPQYQGLGARWQLFYFTVADLEAAGLLDS